MKLSAGSLFGSKKKKNTTRSISRSSIPSFGSGSSSDDSSIHNQTTPRTVLPAPLSIADPFKVSVSDLEVVLRRLGSHPAGHEEELEAVIAEADLDSMGSVPIDGSELRDAFDVFDADKDGKISAEELMEVLISLGDGGCSIEDCRRMIGVVDRDRDGFVGFEDFVRMMELDGQRDEGGKSAYNGRS